MGEFYIFQHNEIGNWFFFNPSWQL